MSRRVDPRSFNLDVSQIESKITDKTKVLLPVHIHGLPADMDEILALAKKHDLLVIEDSCQAHGATYKGKMAGTIGDFGCFSLNATKNLPGGEGGLANTDNEELLKRAKVFRTFGEKVGLQEEEPSRGSPAGVCLAQPTAAAWPLRCGPEPPARIPSRPSASGTASLRRAQTLDGSATHWPQHPLLELLADRPGGC